jgi:hypothetical protein
MLTCLHSKVYRTEALCSSVLTFQERILMSRRIIRGIALAPLKERLDWEGNGIITTRIT